MAGTRKSANAKCDRIRKSEFTDTHFENGEPEAQRTAALMEQVLETEPADMVIFTGDVLGPTCHHPREA